MNVFFYCSGLLGFIFIIGEAANFLIFKEKFMRPWALRLSLAYGLGTGLLGLLLFYLCYAGLEFKIETMVLIGLPFAAVFLYRCGRSLKSFRPHFNRKNFFGANGLLEFFLFLVLAVSLTIIISRALLLPMHLSDDRAQWGLKAKMIYHEKTIFLEALADPDRLQLHLAYPFLIPLLEAGFFTAMGEMNDRFVKLPFAVYFLCLLLFFYSSQRGFASHRHALLFTCVLAVLPSFIRDVLGNPSSGYADVPLAFYFFIAVVGLWNWLQHRQRQHLILSIVFIIFAMFTKQEGLYLWGFMAAAGLLMLVVDSANRDKGSFAAFAAFIVVPLIALAPWFYFKSSFVQSSWEKDWSLAQFAPSYISANLDRVGPILGALKNNFFTVKHWNMLWIIFFGCIVLYPRKSLTIPGLVILLLIGFNIGAVFAAVLLYPWPWWGNFLGDMHRVLLMNVPLVAFYISLRARNLIKL